MINPKKQAKKKNYTNSGVLLISSCKVSNSLSFSLYYIITASFYAYALNIQQWKLYRISLFVSDILLQYSSDLNTVELVLTDGVFLYIFQEIY